MQWSDVICDPVLQDLPYKIELNKWGKIEMSPASNRHAYLQSYISRFLGNNLANGATLSECSVATLQGVKVPDVVWCSDAFLEQHGFETPYSQAPELCVEIVSPSNSKWEMLEKIQLYLTVGAQEVWLVSENGTVEFYDKAGQLSRSRYPVNIDEMLQGLWPVRK